MPARISVHLDQPIGRINPLLQSHFAEHLGNCIEQGLWVGQDSPIENIGGLRRDVIESMRRIKVPLIRWPGGCFADDYHWEDGIGPRKSRPRRVNLWWGQTIEDNSFGTHEFIQLCRLVGAEPYLAGNVGSGSPREMRDWVEYCNFPGDSTLAKRRGENGSPQPFDVRFWGVGNEAWGCGGVFCPEDYAREYRRFANYLHDLGDTPLFLIACGPNGNDPDWTRRFLTALSSFRRIHGLAAHYYTWNRDGRHGTATEFNTEQWYGLLHNALRMEELIIEQRALMDQFDPQRRIALIVDEWGTWHPPAPGRNPSHLWQQNTLRDALVAALTLDIFNRHADKLFMANIAQAVNVLQSLFLTDGDQLVHTPTYHVFDLYKSHQGGQSLRLDIEADPITFPADGQRQTAPAVTGSASLNGNLLTLSIVNLHASLPAEVQIDLPGEVGDGSTLSVLAHQELTAHNTFDAPEELIPRQTAIEPTRQWRQTLPPASINVFHLPMK